MKHKSDTLVGSGLGNTYHLLFSNESQGGSLPRSRQWILEHLWKRFLGNFVLEMT
jgi:hypothetical protein